MSTPRRRLDLERGAPRVPRVRARDDDAGRRGREAQRQPLRHQHLRAALGSPATSIPFYVMKSNGGVLSADEVVHQPITTVLSGPAAGALGAALIAQVAGFPRILTCDGGGTSTDVSVVLDGEPTLTTEGTVGAYPSKIPMIDVVTVGAGGGSIAWLSPEGSLKVGPHSAGADPGPLCYAKGGTQPTITDAHVTLGRIPPHLLGGEIPLDVEAARAGIADLADQLGLDFERCATGILEISAWNQANALRQVSVKRGLDVRDFMLTTFGGSGSLLACRLVDILDLAGVVVPPNPGNVSAFGLLTVDVKNDYVQTHVAKESVARPRGRAGDPRRPHRPRPRGAGQGGLRRRRAPVPADHRRALRRPGLRGAGGRARRRRRCGVRRAGGRRLPRRAPPALRLRLPRRPDPAGRVGQPPRHRHRADHAAGDPDAGEAGLDRRDRFLDRGTRPARQVCFDPDDGYVDTPVIWRTDLGAGDTFTGPAIVEEFGSTIPVHPGFEVVVDDWANLVIRKVVTLMASTSTPPTSPRSRSTRPACRRRTSTAAASRPRARASTRSSSRSSRAPWPASRWRWRPPSGGRRGAR